MPRPSLCSARLLGETVLAGRADGERRPFQRPGTPPRYARDRVADIRHIRLDLTFDFAAKRVSGRCTTTLAPINEALREVEFDAVELNIQRVSRDDAALPFSYDGRKLVVT